jgi:peptidylprolyl isomerase
MKIQTSLSTLLLAAAALPLAAQTAAPKPAASQKPTVVVHHTAATTAVGCVKLPEMSPKIPALPAGACPKVMLKFTSTPNVRLDYVSPIVTPEVREALGLSPTTFELDYVDIKPGTGNLAAPKKWYTLQYTGYLLDGTKFDSSLDRSEPFSFPVGQHRVIAGWDLGFQGMHVGGKRRLIIPAQLAYGDKGQQAIPPRSTLVFDIELISQSDEQPKPPAPPTPPTPPAGTTTPATPPPAGATPPPPPPPPPADKPATPPPAGDKPATPPTRQ